MIRPGHVWLLALASAAAVPAHAQDSAIRTVDPTPGTEATVRPVELNESVFADGADDPEAVEHRRVRNLNSQIGAQLDAARQQADANRRAHAEALDRAAADQRRYEEALARHRAEMEAWQRAVDASSAQQRR